MAGGTRTGSVEIGTIRLGGDASEDDGKFYIPDAPANTARAKPYGHGSSMGAERGRDIGVNGSIDIRFAQQYSTMRHDPHGFYTDILGNKEPMVIDPQGEILVPCHSGDYNHHFTDQIARIWAEQNDGIFFPSHLGSEGNASFPFSDFIRGMERVRPNYQNRDGGYDYGFQKAAHELSMTEGAFDDFAMEARYLDNVHPLHELDSWGEPEKIIGLEGSIHRRDGSEHDCNFGNDRDNQFGVKLGLDLRAGFGAYHFDVSRRVLSVDVGRYSAIYEKSDEESSLRCLVHEFNEGPDRTERHFNFDMKGVRARDRDGGLQDWYDRVIISMEAPYTLGSENQDFRNPGHLEKPVMQTADMLPIFLPLATAAVEGLSRLKKHKEEVERERFREKYDAFRNPQTVVTGFAGPRKDS